MGDMNIGDMNIGDMTSASVHESACQPDSPLRLT